LSVYHSGEDYITRNLMICTRHQILFGNQIEKNEMGGACSTYGEKERGIEDFVGRPEGRQPLGGPRRRWEGTLKMDLQEVGWGHGLD
jgi:hypothetical protein